MKSVMRRLNALEDSAVQDKDKQTVRGWISEGKLYGQLSDDEKELYCYIYGTTVQVFEEVHKAVFDVDDIDEMELYLPDRNPRPLSEIVEEVEKTVLHE